ncbi:MAG: transcription termination factor Rho [Acidimicrobiales bacterium]
MSDQAIVERADLMKKDKGELQTIVEALGGKAASRARKSDLIDQILELSGVVAPAESAADAVAPSETAASAVEPGSADAAESAAPVEAGSRVSAETPSGVGSDGQGESRSGRARRRGGRDAEPPAEWETELQNGAGQGGKKASTATASADSVGADSASADKGASDRSGSTGKAGTDKGASDRSGSTGKAGTDKGATDRAAADRAGEDDGQNRRRRRRGRNRDRDDEGPATLEPVAIEGFLELRDDGYGFVRVNGWIQSRDDVYVSVKMVRQLGLRRGDHIVGTAKPATRNEKNPAIEQIDKINGLDPDEAKDRPLFDDLTPVFPSERLALGADDAPVSAKVVDAVAPLGKGQRGLLLTPPSSGKTTLIADLAAALEAGHPEAEVVVLLIDERPEEVTDLRRRLGDAEVVASAFDRPPEEHVALTELTVERAKRLAERGHDVIILLDGLTRLTRAHNLVGAGANRILPGGLDAAALYPGKRVMGAARKLDEGGSITIIATLMTETGSAMDDAIVAEFADTANAELVLDRQLAADGVFPALDLERCTTRNAQLLGDPAPVSADSVRSVLESFGGSPGVPR